jgi:uncharacterized protein (DUF2141 family)
MIRRVLLGASLLVAFAFIAYSPHEPDLEPPSVTIPEPQVELVDDQRSIGSEVSEIPEATTRLPGAQLVITVDGLKPGVGTVRAALFANARDFPDMAKAMRLASVEAPEAAAVTLELNDVEPGTYALAVYQDTNDDQQLNKAKVGYPLEPYGFSENARRILGPPPFVDAAFAVDQDRVELSISVK